MTTCHDPYKELDIYLEQAQEAVGLAVKELEDHEEIILSPEALRPENSLNENILPPPQAFQSESCLFANRTNVPKPNNAKSLPRSLITQHTNSRIYPSFSTEPHSLQNPHSLESYSRSGIQKPNSLFGSQRTDRHSVDQQQYGTIPCSPNTRKRLWRMHPSISFPETSRDLLLLGKEAESNSKPSLNIVIDKDFEAVRPTYRQRSNSETGPYYHRTKVREFNPFPRPPSGDVNLLSIWADNLVMELDKSLSEELVEFPESYTPSSDYSLSPMKQDESLDAISFENTPFEVESVNVEKCRSVDSGIVTFTGRSLKSLSRSPDSGIEQAFCNTPDIVEDTVDSVIHQETPEVVNNVSPKNAAISVVEKAEESDNVKDKSQYTQTSPCLHKKHFCLKTAEINIEPQQTEDVLVSQSEQAAHVIPLEVVEPENTGIVKTVCTTSNVPVVESYSEDVSSVSREAILHYPNYEIESIVGPIFSSLPKPPKSIPNGFDKYHSLPRVEKSTSNFVSIDELAAFMHNLGCHLSQFPYSADASTDVKADDADNKDAITQTTPISLSRSSSLTWVTDCECSDWGVPYEHLRSDESISFSDCSSCKERTEKPNSSSSSTSLSSDEDDQSQGSSESADSSLYLSACSGSSDSFEDATPTSISQTTSSDDIFKDPIFNYRPYRSSETTLRGSTLGDISEEHILGETVSMTSNLSNPSTMDSPTEHSASFPSTLSRKAKSTGSPAQPIEPTVLVINEIKSASAPVLMRQKRHLPPAKPSDSSSSDSSPPFCLRSKDSESAEDTKVPAKAYSAKELNELQAIEACSWLRAAGFPQYAQMYEDNQFPIEVSIVQNDHAFLHPDSLQSLFRRLNTLNRCAKMKFVDNAHRKSLFMEDSDDEEQYALSENWEFQRSSRRWSRIPPMGETKESVLHDSSASTKPLSQSLTVSGCKYLCPEETYCSSHDSVFGDDQYSSPDSTRRSSLIKTEKISMSPSHIGNCSPGSSSGSGGTLSLVSEDTQERRTLRRSGSDRVKEGAKALLRRMESLKGKKKKKTVEMKKVEKDKAQEGNDGSSSSSVTSSPQFQRSRRPEIIIPDGQFELDFKEGINVPSKKRSDKEAHSDSECHFLLSSDPWENDSDIIDTRKSRDLLTVTYSSRERPSFFDDKREKKRIVGKSKSEKKRSSHTNSDDAHNSKNLDKRSSYYDNVCAPLVVFNDLFIESSNGSEAKSASTTSPFHPSFADKDGIQTPDDSDIIIINKDRRDSGVGSSLTRGVTYQQAPWHCFLHISSDVKPITSPLRISDLTVPQILLLRKLSLLKLTAVMEKFSPSSRTGWSWGVSKFIHRIRNPDYKDKVVFGVPLLLILQRTGQTLPVSIQEAIHYLRKTALDSTGLFRKSGVRSRIQNLRNLNENSPEKINYEEQQSYDVADMLKQYFRELPEALLTNKLSETFISIFTFVPEELRLEAIQAALMLLPDENREVLQALLEFLDEVSQHSGINQMTATNLAVCFAPSLFHLIKPRSASSSPRRRKTVGLPDPRELNENRAAYECLASMLANYKTLFSLTDEVISQSRLSAALHLQPPTLDDLSAIICSGQKGWKAYIDSCIHIFLKEAKEKYKGWKTISQSDHVELSYKKMSDGHPLKLWKASTEVEAPPTELLNRILRERHLWDHSISKWKIIAGLNKNTEVFQYLSESLPPHPPCDFCLLRSWRTDLPKGTCILVETSVEHPDAEISPGSVRAHVLASRYLIEPCGSGKSRVTHISRIDTRGRTPEWYNRAYGHICTLLFIKLRNSFSSSRAEGPETKV